MCPIVRLSCIHGYLAHAVLERRAGQGAGVAQTCEYGSCALRFLQSPSARRLRRLRLARQHMARHHMVWSPLT